MSTPRTRLQFAKAPNHQIKLLKKIGLEISELCWFQIDINWTTCRDCREPRYIDSGGHQGLPITLNHAKQSDFLASWH